MAAWKRICCAVDFSSCSHDAVEAAARLAGGLGAKLTLLHVYSPPLSAIASDVVSFTAADIEGEALRDAERRMWALRADAERLAGGAEVVSRCVPGNPADEILRAVGEGGHDLLVVGTHGRGGLKRLVLGSIAERVVRASPVPVLVARGEHCFELPGED
jgi:nucleotide-binding universal stress UspA family protein